MSTKTTVVNLRKEPYDIYIGRPGHGKDGPWGNPFTIGRDGTREEVIEKYRFWITRGTGSHLLGQLESLRGKRLGCWCKPQACHGDVLVELLEAKELAGQLDPEPPKA